MNTWSMYELLWKDIKSSAFVMAVMPSTGLNHVRSDSKERCYIINVRGRHSPSRMVFGHWIVLVTVHGRAVEVFDSLGPQGFYNKDIKTFFSKYGHQSINTVLLDTKNCGFYCLAYVYYRSRGVNPEKVLNILKSMQDIKNECQSLFCQ